MTKLFSGDFMKYNINIKLHILLASLFLIFNLSCEDDDYPSGDLEETYTYSLSLESSITNESTINYADGPTAETRNEDQTVTLTLLEIDSNGSSKPLPNASVKFIIITDLTIFILRYIF